MADKPIPQKRKYRNDLTAEYVRSILHYEPNSGRLIWKPRSSPYWWNGKFSGVTAGYLDTKGHRQVEIDGVAYIAARINWLIQTGEWPDREVDHENVTPDDNRWFNLRLATTGENCRNKTKRPDNTSGFKGVSKHGRGWRFSVTHNGIRFISGVFSSPEAAHAGYLERTSEINGGFARIDRTVSRAIFAPDNGS